MTEQLMMLRVLTLVGSNAEQKREVARLMLSRMNGVREVGGVGSVAWRQSACTLAPLSNPVSP